MQITGVNRSTKISTYSFEVCVDDVLSMEVSYSIGYSACLDKIAINVSESPEKFSHTIGSREHPLRFLIYSLRVPPSAQGVINDG